MRDASTGQTASAFVNIVFAPPTAPYTRPDIYTCIAGRPCMPPTSVLINDVSPANGTLSVIGLESQPLPSGFVVMFPNGSLWFTPEPL